MCDECPKIYLKQRTLELHKKRVHRGTLPKSNNRYDLFLDGFYGTQCLKDFEVCRTRSSCRVVQL